MSQITEAFLWLIFVVVCLALAAGVVGGVCYAYPQYGVYTKTKGGEALLKEAEQSRQIAVEEARARLESAKFDASAEIERAKGVAEANRIIGDSLKGNDSYLHYLWINGLHDKNSETIYIPTEANLPILEAGRFATERGPP